MGLEVEDEKPEVDSILVFPTWSIFQGNLKSGHEEIMRDQYCTGTYKIF